MQDRIRALSQFMKDKRVAGDRFVLMLGAGASLSSGIKPTRVLMEELVEKNGTGPPGRSLEDRFNELWQSANSAHRALMLKPYLDAVPAKGYRQLAEIIRSGYIDTILTFNFDTLLERALDESGVTGYRALIRGEMDFDVMSKLLASKEIAVKILKLHGSLRSVDTLLFDQEEMLNYPRDLESLIQEVTGRDIIICGYGFADMCMKRAFNGSKESGSIYYVNPSGAVTDIKGFLLARRSTGNVIEGELGQFDVFMEALHTELTVQRSDATAAPRQNPFTFLDHYREGQQEWLLGRRKPARDLLGRIASGTDPVQIVMAKPKVGKTSFVRAGVIPKLDPNVYDVLYVRCRSDIAPQLRAEFQQRLPPGAVVDDWNSILIALKAQTTKRIVLFLDQFERPCRAALVSPDSERGALETITALVRHADERLSVVFVASDEMAFSKFMWMRAQLDKRPSFLELKPFSPEAVARILRYAARKGGVTLEPDAVETLVKEYRDGIASEPPVFTLLHVQAVCYYLVRGYQPYRGYRQLPPGGLVAALKTFNEESNVIDLLADVPAAQRYLLRRFLKVICDPGSSTEKLIEFIRRHFPDVEKEEPFPEPIQ
jgi:NAD-dependent SIR2 family protein deacetylase